MYYYKARYYDPETGRFLTTDPIGYADQINLYAYVGNDPVNGIDPSGLEEKEITRWVAPPTGSRIGGGSKSITVDTELGGAELAKIAAELPDKFLTQYNGENFSKFDQGTPGFIDGDGDVSNGKGYENERERVRIGGQISRGVNTVAEEWDLRSGGFLKPFLYNPWSTSYGNHHPLALVIGKPSVSRGMQQTIMTIYHERLHFRWGAEPSEHQKVYNKVYDDLTPLGFTGHYKCLDKKVGCR